jgi:hypothetical protein
MPCTIWKYPEIFKIGKSKKHMAVLHSDEQTTLPLVRTKLRRPAVTKDHLHRECLLDRLEKNRQRPLAQVLAPAGYGKSTLFSCWLDLLHRDHIETSVSHRPP